MTETQLGSSGVDLDSRELANRIRTTLAGRRRLEVEDPALTCAAVLVPLLYREEEWHVLVTQRTQTVDHHKGQIAFPGGACDPDDADREVIQNRIEVYERETRPVLEAYPKKLLARVNADQPPLAVLRDVADCLTDAVPATI